MQRKITSKKNLTCIEILGKNMGNKKRNTEKQKQKTTVTDTFITSNGVPCTDNTDIANNMIFTSKGKSYNKNVSNIKIDGNSIQQVNKKVSRYYYWGASKLGDAHLPFMQYNCKKCWHSSKVTIFCSDLCIENSIPFIDIDAPTILHIIMGKFILFTSTESEAITKESYKNNIKCRLSCPFQKAFFEPQIAKTWWHNAISIRYIYVQI